MKEIITVGDLKEALADVPDHYEISGRVVPQRRDVDGFLELTKACKCPKCGEVTECKCPECGYEEGEE